jgi:FKBP-type peptidyl-prolyl cis-trans isomerase
VPKPVPADYDALFLMAVGDSMTVFVTGDKLAAMPNLIRQADDTLIFDIVLREILETKAEIAARRNPADDAMNRAVQGARAYGDGLLASVLQSTASGLQYMLFSQGDGEFPVEGQRPRIHYYGVTDAGDRIDESYNKGEPFEFVLGRNQVMPGLDEGIRLLKPGGSALLILPPDLAYGQMGLRDLVAPNTTVIYFVELADVAP